MTLLQAVSCLFAGFHFFAPRPAHAYIAYHPPIISSSSTLHQPIIHSSSTLHSKDTYIHGFWPHPGSLAAVMILALPWFCAVTTTCQQWERVVCNAGYSDAYNLLKQCPLARANCRLAPSSDMLVQAVLCLFTPVLRLQFFRPTPGSCLHRCPSTGHQVDIDWT